MSLQLRRRSLLLAVATAATSGAALRPANAAPLATPAGKVILTISGRISVTNGAETASFDREMLEALGTRSFTTQTPWYNAPVKFEGVPLDKLMGVVGASGDHVTALALNDYSTDIPIDDFSKYNVILALKRDGDYMPVKDKGPLFIVYPYDSAPELKHQKFYSRSAWQVARIVVK
jgi:hypothetical protein